MAHPKRWHHRLRHSLRWRLVTLFLLLALAMSVAFVGGMQKSFAVGWREAVRPLLADYVDRLAADLGSPPDVARAQALVARLPISVRIDGPLTQFDSHPKRQDERWRHGDYGKDVANARLLERSLPDGHTIRFGLGDLDWQRGPGAFAWVTLSVLLLLTALAFAYVRRLLKPLDDIGAGAKRFGAGDFGQKIPVRRHDELGDLAGQINTMGQDIHQMLEAKRALLLAISHELRSPLTRARLNVELLPESPETGAQRDALLRDLTEMGRLISDLLESERLSSRHAALNLEMTDVGALVQAVVDEVAAEPAPGQGGSANASAGELASRLGQTPISVKIGPGLPHLQLDRVRFKLLLRNLLDNARRYSLEPGADSNMDSGPEFRPDSTSGVVKTIEVNLGQQGEALLLTVRDHGPGVPEAQLPHLAEPFFRTDSARQRSTGGVGLGLHLCQLITRAHGGSLTLRNALPGLEAAVRLPVSDLGAK
jgi:signal transduction histidine kinase